MEIVKSGILVLFVLLIRKLAKNHISRRAQYSLWIFVAVYMLLWPVITIPGFYSVDALAKSVIVDSAKFEPVQGVFVEDSNRVENETSDQVLYVADNNGSTQVSRQISIMTVWGNVKRIVQLSILAYFLISNIVLYIICRKNRLPYEEDKISGLMVYLLEGIGTPFLFGKSIYLNTSMTGDQKALRHMIVHEYVHSKHYDHIWVIVKNVCLALNWYNPFMWIANEYMKRDCELACDEEVLKILGEAERADYSHTLIMIAGFKGKRLSAASTTSMSSSMRRMRERIDSISSVTVNRMVVVIAALLCMLFVTGFSFVVTRNDTFEDEAPVKTDVITDEKTSKETKELSDDAVPTVEMLEIVDTSGNYYNTVKYYDGYYYYSDTDAVKRLDKSLKASEVLADGYARLGNVDRGYLYYLRFPSDKDTAGGILRLNIDSGQEEEIVEWSDDMWLCSNIYTNDSILYLERSDGCDSYTVDDSGVRKQDLSENKVFQDIERYREIDDIIGFPFGFINAYFEFGKLVFYAGDYRIGVFDVENGTIEETIDDCLADILICSRGIVYKDKDSNIYEKEWDKTDSVILYDVKENGGEIVNYGAIDNDMIYGFVEKGNSCRFVRISWAGKYEFIEDINNNRKSVDLGLSVNDGVYSYWRNEKIEFKHL